MDTVKIFDDLYMFRSGGVGFPITFNQFLLLGKEPVLIHTGNNKQAEELLPLVKSVLGTGMLKYIFVSHFESDECGGLGIITKTYPDAVTICSQVTARQLTGFGFNYKLLAKAPGDMLELADCEFSFIGYPSEVHLWEGLLPVETNRKLLFSSDLFIHFEKINDIWMDANLKEEIGGITTQQITAAAYSDLKQILLGLDIDYIAPGHGPVIKAV